MRNIVLTAGGLEFTGIEDGPSDGQLILFLHGFPEFADTWAEVINRAGAAGFRAVAVDQRGYSRAARPPNISDYAVEHLTGDVLRFADQLGADRFHLAGHDWGGLLAWKIAADHPERICSLSVLSTPHPNAFFEALENDSDQKLRSKYIAMFRLPGGVAEMSFQAFDWKLLRGVYQGKAPEHLIETNIQRLSEPGALTAALNWYRALDMNIRVAAVSVPTLYIWSTKDIALGETAALATSKFVTGPYRFERLEGRTHWLTHEAPDLITDLLLRHFADASSGC